MNASDEVLRDLPAPMISTSDEFERWELSQPFVRCTISAYLHQMNAAHESCGAEGRISREALQQHFNTQAWAELRKETSKFSTFLSTTLMHESGKGVDYESMICMGLLHCQDKRKPETKANAFFELLQDGGIDKQQFISSQDKDWKPVTKKLFSAATIFVNAGLGGNYYNE